MLKDLIEIARPHQWVKNSLLFASLVFSQSFTNLFMVKKTVLGFILFCALSSAVYIINDITDRNADRAHPDKRNRPIAAGRLSVNVALVLALLLLAFSLIGSFWLRTNFGYCALGYLGLNLAYSFLLKHVV
ncbi:MAG: UbiA family prenyltransferase, partial [Candidatus Zixiibacteriota bacterium]